MPILTELNLYPIKSCAGITLQQATLTEFGLMSQHIYDRQWMIVDEQGKFLTQREYPRMALITPRIRSEVLELNAPAAAAMEIPLGLPDAEYAFTRQVQVWDDTIPAYDCGENSAAWFSKVLGTACRLVRFHPQTRRLADREWTGELEAPTLFADDFPLLLISEASLQDLNQKLQKQARAPLPMNRFRPNIVIDGLDPFEEDYTALFTIGAVVLKPVKPCPRCPIPSIDQASGTIGPDPLDILQTYRANPKVDGGITFGMNTLIMQGIGEVLRVGQTVETELAFE